MGSHLSSLYANSLLNILETMGFPRARGLSSLGQTEDTIQSVRTRINAADMRRTFAEAANALDEPHIGLQVGFKFRVHTFTETGSVLAHARTIAEAVEINAAYQPLVETVGVCSPSRGTHDEMRWDFCGQDQEADRQLAELVMTGYASTSHWLAWSLPGGLTRAGFAHSAPASTTAHEVIFQCPVEFGCDRNYIRYTPGLVDQPLPSSNPDKLMRLRRRLDVVLSKVAKTTRLRETLALEITRALRDGTVTEAVIADRLEVSSRSLSRALREEGTSFRDVLRKTRMQMAVTYLRDDRPLREITHLLAYNDQPAFTRAFKRWFGVPPSEYRTRHLEDVEQLDF